MDDRQKELSNYRIQEAENSLKVAKHCLNEGLIKTQLIVLTIRHFIQLKRYWH